MEQQDPNLVMLDQIVRVLLSEAMRAIVWCAVASFFYALYRRLLR